MGVMPELDDVDITLIGHPFASIGMGEQLRSHISACAALRLRFGVLDIFRYAPRTDPSHLALLAGRERKHAPPGGIRIFHVNGDEVERVLAAFTAAGGAFDAGYNIIVPAWELPSYPREWAVSLGRFDEVWALSGFIRESLAAAGITAPLIGQSVQSDPMPFLPRRFFGIRESSFVLLHFLDLTSYATRKNPAAVLDLARMLWAEAPFRDLRVVLKVKDGEQGARDWAATLGADSRVQIIDAPLDSFATRSLLNCCDCFVSLHRAEGFGRGLGEAMALGKLALGTGWSGNLDFMTPQNSLLVRHTLAPLAPDAYPHWQGQSWAEPDVAHAAALLRPFLADATRGRAIAMRGQGDVLRSHGDRAVGLRVLAQLVQIVAMRGKSLRTPSPQRRKRARNGVPAAG
jgi:hypothetical protein